VELAQPPSARQLQLRSTYGFECGCVRCAAPVTPAQLEAREQDDELEARLVVRGGSISATSAIAPALVECVRRVMASRRVRQYASHAACSCGISCASLSLSLSLCVCVCVCVCHAAMPQPLERAEPALRRAAEWVGASASCDDIAAERAHLARALSARRSVLHPRHVLVHEALMLSHQAALAAGDMDEATKLGLELVASQQISCLIEAPSGRHLFFRWPCAWNDWTGHTTAPLLLGVGREEGGGPTDSLSTRDSRPGGMGSRVCLLQVCCVSAPPTPRVAALHDG
jgi:hypothetical protein